MVHLVMTPMVSNMRVYSEPGGYETRRPYLAILTIMHLTDKTVYLMGAVGTVNRETWTKAFDMLRAAGVTTALLERRGVLRTMHLKETDEHL